MAQHTIQIQITKCAYVRADYPDTNYGTEAVLKTGGYKRWQGETFYFEYVFLINWDRAKLPTPVNQEGGINRKRLISANLKLYSLVNLSRRREITMLYNTKKMVTEWNDTNIIYNWLPDLTYRRYFLNQGDGPDTGYIVTANSYFNAPFNPNELYDPLYENGMIVFNYPWGATEWTTMLEVSSTRATNKPYIELVYEDIAPSPPILISPKSETKRNDEVTRFEWQYQSEANDQQTKFDLQWSSNNGATWNTITQATPNQYYDMPANTLPVGSILWRVKTYSTDGLASEYSDQAAFTAAGKPDAPVLTKPNATENTSRPLIAWTASGQVMYQAQVLQGSNVVWDSGEVASTSGEVQAGTNLSDNTSYTARVRIKNQYDLWSDWASKAFTVDFELPNKPTFDIVKDLVRASIRLTVTNPTPDGTGGFSYNEVYRRKVNGSWVKIASNIARNGTYEDCAMASSQPYEYMVRTIGTYGYMDSDIKYADIRVRNSQLASISDKGVYVPLIYDPKRNISLNIDRALMKFAGREKPVSEFGESKDFGIALSFVIKDIEDLDTLMALIESAETLLYRDNRGRKIYCTIGGLSIDEERKYWTVSFAVAEVSHQEGV